MPFALLALVAMLVAPSPSPLPSASPSPPSRPLRCATLACIKLGNDPNAYVTLGVDVRLKDEHFFNKTWNANANGYLLDRELANVDVHVDRLQAIVQLEHAGVTNGHAPVDPTWRDDFATTTAAVEYAFGGVTGSATPPLALRVGRQLLAYGSERMIDDRSGLNAEAPFDGVRARVNTPGWRTDVFVVRPVSVGPFGFDDLADRGRTLGGVYATHAAGPQTLDLYALVDQRRSQSYARGAAPEVRDTLGVRYAVATRTFDADTEVDGQIGSFGGAVIDAYAVETNLGWDIPRGRDRLRLGVGGGIASGDRAPSSAHLTTFRAPYPTGLTFGIIEANGNENTSGFTPNVSYTHANVTLAVKDYFFYRQSLLDGVYSAPGLLLRAPARSDAAPIGNLGYVSLVDVLDRHTTVYAAYARYLIGSFLRESPQATGAPSLSTAYFNVWFDTKL